MAEVKELKWKWANQKETPDFSELRYDLSSLKNAIENLQVTIIELTKELKARK